MIDFEMFANDFVTALTAGDSKAVLAMAATLSNYTDTEAAVKAITANLEAREDTGVDLESALATLAVGNAVVAAEVAEAAPLEA